MIHKFILARAECGCILAGIADVSDIEAVAFMRDQKRLGRSIEHLSVSGINPGPQLHVCTHEREERSFKKRLGHLTRGFRGA